MLCTNVSSLMFTQGWNYVTYGLRGKLGDGYPGALSISFTKLATFVECVITQNLKVGERERPKKDREEKEKKQ